MANDYKDYKDIPLLQLWWYAVTTLRTTALTYPLLTHPVSNRRKNLSEPATEQDLDRYLRGTNGMNT